jgi:hypothetical protein
MTNTMAEENPEGPEIITAPNAAQTINAALFAALTKAGLPATSTDEVAKAGKTIEDAITEIAENMGEGMPPSFDDIATENLLSPANTDPEAAQNFFTDQIISPENADPTDLIGDSDALGGDAEMDKTKAPKTEDEGKATGSRAKQADNIVESKPKSGAKPSTQPGEPSGNETDHQPAVEEESLEPGGQADTEPAVGVPAEPDQTPAPEAGPEVGSDARKTPDPEAGPKTPTNTPTGRQTQGDEGQPVQTDENPAGEQTVAGQPTDQASAQTSPQEPGTKGDSAPGGEEKKKDGEVEKEGEGKEKNERPKEDPPVEQNGAGKPKENKPNQTTPEQEREQAAQLSKDRNKAASPGQKQPEQKGMEKSREIPEEKIAQKEEEFSNNAFIFWLFLALTADAFSIIPVAGVLASWPFATAFLAYKLKKGFKKTTSVGVSILDFIIEGLLSTLPISTVDVIITFIISKWGKIIIEEEKKIPLKKMSKWPPSTNPGTASGTEKSKPNTP